MSEPIEGVINAMHEQFEKTFSQQPAKEQTHQPHEECNIDAGPESYQPEQEEHGKNSRGREKREEPEDEADDIVLEQKREMGGDEPRDELVCQQLESTKRKGEEEEDQESKAKQWNIEEEVIQQQPPPSPEQKHPQTPIFYSQTSPSPPQALSPQQQLSPHQELSETEEDKAHILQDTRHDSPILFKNKTEPTQLLTAEQLDLDQGTEIKPLNLQMSTEEVQEHEELISYRALTQKFEMALSRIKHAPSASDFAARQSDYLKKKESDLSMLRKQKQKLEKSRCSGRPLINSRSQQLLGYRPIQTRYKEVLKEKEKKLELEQAEKKRREEKEEEQIIKEMEEHQKKVKNKFGTLRSKEGYYDWMQSWDQERKKKVEEMAALQGLSKQEEATFKPRLNEKSQAMMKKKGQRVPIYEKEPATKKPGVDQHCTFKPNLTKRLHK